MEKLLSVIIPTYNMEALLPQCLDSLLVPQMVEALDVIIVNDGSKDQSLEIANSYAEKFPNVFCVIDKKNGNYGSCINAALPTIRGKYVKILDADDSYEKNNLCDFLALLNILDVDLVLTDYATYNSEGSKLSECGYSLPKRQIFHFGVIPQHTYLCMHSVTYRSAIFKRIEYHQSEGVSYTDMEWVCYPMSEVRKVFYYDVLIYKYLIGREGQTADDEVRLKRLSHVAAGVWAMGKSFRKVPQDNPAYQYIKDMYYGRTRWVYFCSLIYRNVTFDLDSFDKKLKEEDIDLYNYIGGFRLPMDKIHISIPLFWLWRIVRKKSLLWLFPQYALYKFYRSFERLV